jgi:uncharacterized phage protein (TIGR01671 family)
MREYKFRAFHKGAKEMLFGANENIFRWQSEGQPIEIMQFTGLKDRHGKEIYDGDIVRILYSDWVSQSDYSITLEQHKINKSYVGTVVFEDGKYLLQFDGYTDTLHHGVHGERHIIGNIYENPELLK